MWKNGQSDAVLLTFLKMEEGGHEQRMWVTSRCWKRQEHGFSPEPLERNTVLVSPFFPPLRPSLDF